MMLILKNKSVEKADCSGDGTGYSLTVKKHHAGSVNISSYLDRLNGPYSAEDRCVLQTMGLGAYSSSGSAYAMHAKEKKNMPYER